MLPDDVGSMVRWKEGCPKCLENPTQPKSTGCHPCPSDKESNSNGALVPSDYTRMPSDDERIYYRKGDSHYQWKIKMSSGLLTHLALKPRLEWGSDCGSCLSEMTIQVLEHLISQLESPVGSYGQRNGFFPTFGGGAI